MKEKIENIVINNSKGGKRIKILKDENLIDGLMVLTNFLNKRYGDPIFAQRLWHIENKNYDIVFCEICKINPAKYSTSHNKKYVCCSSKCSRIKLKATSIVVYGVDNPAKNSIVKAKNALVVSSSLTDEIKDKIKKTNTRKYGVDSYLRTEEFRKIFSMNYQKKLEGKLGDQYEIIDINSNDVKIKHILCDSIFSMKRQTCNARLRNELCVCNICNPVNFSTSTTEKSVNDFIMTKYKDCGFVSNFRGFNWLRRPGSKNNMEIDIFSPLINFGIEVQETTFHADPFVYSAEYYNGRIKMFAKDIWARDKIKFDLCRSMNIEVIQIWEKDWREDKLSVQNIISERIDCYFSS